MKGFSVPNPLKAAKQGIKRVVEKVKEATQLDFSARFHPSKNDPGIDFPIDMGRDTIWATKKQMAALFGVEEAVVDEHISSIFSKNELPKAEHQTLIPLRTVSSDEQAAELVSHFSLDMIFTVGYRIDGGRTAQFREWANNVLRGYVIDGYALDGRRLENDPTALLNLAAEVRSIRTSEKQIYEQVREAFKVCSIDYDSS